MTRLIILLMFVASCGPPQFIRYDLDTEVARDGTWTRTYAGRGYRETPAPPHAPEYARVDGAHCAALPPCPSRAGEEPLPELPVCAAAELWPIREEMVDDRCGAILRRETFRRVGAANVEIGPDFAEHRTIGGTERTAGNLIGLRRIDLGVLVFYEHRETFQQWLTASDVIDAGRVALDLLLAFSLEALRGELGVDYDTSWAEDYLRELRAELGEIVAIAAFTDLDWKRAGEEAFRRLRLRGVPSNDRGQPDENLFGEWFDAHISPNLAPKNPKAPRLTWADLSTEYYQGYLEAKWTHRVEELTKEGGPLKQQLNLLDGPFRRTHFRVRVRLPGRLVDTDGAVGADGAVAWRLDPDAFEVEPREIHALSVEIGKRFTRLYPRADIDGQGLVAIGEIARALTDDERARAAGLLTTRDTAALTAWCGESLPARRLVRLLGLELRCQTVP